MGTTRVTRGLLLATLSSLVALVTLPAFAGTTAGGVVPVLGAPNLVRDDHAVELVSAFLHARVEAESMHLECVYVLRNRGDSTSVRMAFPGIRDAPGGVRGRSPFREVESFVDGVPVRPRTLADTSDDRPSDAFLTWWLEAVPFAAHQTRCVRDVYQGEGLLTLRNGDFGYELFPPGRGWAGPIGTCEIVVTLDLLGPGDEVVQSLPVATSHDGREWRWHFDGILPGTPALPLVAVFWRRGANPQSRWR